MFIERLFRLPGNVKTTILAVWDTSSILLALFLAYSIRVGIQGWDVGALEISIYFATVVFTLSVLILLGHYQQVIRYINVRAVIIVIVGCLASTCYLLMSRALLDLYLPLSVPFIYLVFSASLIAIPRLLLQSAFQIQRYQICERCIIFGATEVGRLLASTLRGGNEMVPVAFVDDKRSLQGKQIMGLPVTSREDIPALAKKYGVKKVLLAVNNSSVKRRKELIAELEPFAIELLSVPNITDIVSGKKRIDDLSEIRIEELLGREPVSPIDSLLKANIKDQCVMITGAGGSIGSELCRQIATLGPKQIILFEQCEFNLYNIERELLLTVQNVDVISKLASVQDNDALREVFNRYSVDTIYHAAAYKHVPMLERNIMVGIRNNIFGTTNVALLAAEYEVKKFVLVSTDKAVRPTNVMGATKRFAELFVQALAELHPTTEYAIVRFGNVLGSSGSVVPVFRQQIQKGGPITVTHPEITRYFMTIPEASQLVIQAGAMGKNGEVFVLDMGQSVKIVDLARKMAHLGGFNTFIEGEPQDGIEIRFSGLRPGEKLYEELLIDDADSETQHPRIMGANETKLDFAEVVVLLDRLNFAYMTKNEDMALQLLREAPLAYQPQQSASDNFKMAAGA